MISPVGYAENKEIIRGPPIVVASACGIQRQPLGCVLDDENARFTVRCQNWLHRDAETFALGLIRVIQAKAWPHVGWAKLQA